MQKIIIGLLLLFGNLFSQVSYSPYCVGDSSKEKHQRLREGIEAIINKPYVKCTEKDGIWFFNSYTYIEVSDSVVIIPEVFFDKNIIILRHLEPTDFKEALPIEVEYIHYTKDSIEVRGSIHENKKITVTGMVFRTWYDPSFSKVKEDTKKQANKLYLKNKKEVDVLCSDEKDWYVNNKKLKKKEKRNYAWKLVNKKIKSSNITKKGK